MNCLDFRREKLADPHRLTSMAEAHAAGCPACAAFAADVDESEAALDRALSVPVPEGLADRIILSARHPRRARRAWAAAASVLVAAALSLGYWADRPSGDEYARLAIEHVVMEPESFATVRHADPDAFRAVVQKLGGSVQDLPGGLRYLKLCPVEEGLGWHVVFETPDGLATLFLVPGKDPKAIQAASFGGFSAAVHPAPGGYYAIVTASTAATARFNHKLQESIVWRS